MSTVQDRYLIGLISFWLAGCLSPIAITPGPPKPTAAAIAGTTTLTTTRFVATPAAMVTSTTSAATEAAETPAMPCKQTPYASELPTSDHMASFTTTWFRNEESTLWAGLAPPYAGKWYSGPAGVKVLWWRREGTFRAPLQVEGYQFESQGQSLQAEIPAGYSGTSYQASGLIFPESGCWQVTGKSGDREITFVIWVNPAEDHPLNIR